MIPSQLHCSRPRRSFGGAVRITNVLLLPLWASLVTSALAVEPLDVSVSINGRSVAPSAGSAAGVWFYAPQGLASQVLLTGHAAVPGSWEVTASLAQGDEARLSFPGEHTRLTDIQFHCEHLGRESLVCRAESYALVITSSIAGAVRLTDFEVNGSPISFAPVRRPFSRGPVTTSPDPHPAIAEALIEWDWRMQDGIQTPREPRTYSQALEKLVRQMDALVTERSRLGTVSPAETSAWVTFRNSVGATMEPDSAKARWLELHRLRRRVVLSNPLFGIPSLMFLKHVPSVMSHQLTQVYGYCARPGGGLFVLEKPGVSMRTRELTPASLPPGNFMTPELSYDQQRLLFAYCPVSEAPSSWDYNEKTRHLRYHIYELSLLEGTVRALTAGDTDNFSPIVLPSEELLFLSTRRGGYHRCGRGPCFVYTLARMGKNGENPRSVSFHETHEWDPSLLNDGRVIYTRWDYVDRNAVHYQQLWSALPEGNNAQIYYGNNTWNPTGIWEARAIPGSSSIMATAAPHHGMSAGSVILVNTTRGVDGAEPVARLTPDVRFPESESPLAFGPSPTGYDFDTPVTQHWQTPLQDPSRVQAIPEEEKRWPGHCYKSPWPLSETFFIVSYSFDQLVGEPGPNMPNMFGLYFADAFGNKELVYRDPAISSLWARPLAPRRTPPDLTRVSSGTNTATGTFFLQNVTESWPDLPAQHAITQLRIIQVLVKTTPNADSPRVGEAFAAPGKQVLGTVPVETDGSALFEVPARTPVLFQALNAEGRAVQTMRSLVYLQPGEHQSCVGCHEHRMRSIAPQGPAEALRRPPSEIKPGPEGSRPFSYPRLVQSVLDRQCVSCHDGKDPGRPVLTGEPEGDFSKSYNALVARVSISAWGRSENNFEPLTAPLRFGAAASPLMKMLDQGHGEVVLTDEDHERLCTWIDANALFYGTFDVAEQRKQLAGEMIPVPKQ